MSANGSGVKRLTSNNVFEGDPVFSPDGSRILFVSGDAGSEDIFSMNLSGGDIKNLTNSPGTDRFPNFAPNGRIVFMSSRTGDSDIYIMDADGGHPQDLTNFPGIDTDPAVTPDGQRIIFASTRSGNFDLYSMQLNGTNPVNLTKTAFAERFPDVR
jgi:TolB protein